MRGHDADTGVDMTENEKLTDRFVKLAAAPDEGRPYRIYYDPEVKGFGLRVTKAGFRAFILNYRARGVERRYTIGSFPDWTVSAAREEAKRIKRFVDQGRDPMGERHEERAAPTVNDLIDRYLAEHAPRKRERSRQEDESLIRQWIRPELGNKRVADLRHADVERLHRKITAKGVPIRANRAAALLSKMFSLAATRWEMRSDNPCRGLERNTEEKRNRYLAGDELRRLTEAGRSPEPGRGQRDPAVVANRCASGRGPRRVLGSVRPRGRRLDEGRFFYEAEEAAPGAAVGAGAATSRRDKGSGRWGESGTVTVRFSCPADRAEGRWPPGRDQGSMGRHLQGGAAQRRACARFEAQLRVDPGERWIVASSDRRATRPHPAGDDRPLCASVR